MAKKQKILQSVPLVAIDLGSHSVRAMAAEMTGQNTLRVLGVEYSNKFECVERGMVTILSVIKSVEKKLLNRY